jgi:AhpC/TSA family/Disulphide bond corrector protein DsbC
MEQGGVGLAAVSYDSQETLRGFAEKYKIGFPLLSDAGSAVIRSFGIFNVNIAPGLRSYGVPHPVEYLVAPDGVVVRKYFVPNYQHRVTGSAVALREFGAVGGDAPVVRVRSGALTVEIGLSSDRGFAGQEMGFLAKFVVEPGWHVYGTPASEAYTATSVTFDDPKIVGQSFELPRAELISVLGETVPVYSGSFQGIGSVLLKFPLEAGAVRLAGRIRFQLCSDTVCEAPEVEEFELPVTLEQFVVATPVK